MLIKSSCYRNQTLSVLGPGYVSCSLQTQTYFRLSLGSAENNACEPEPEKDFCHVIVFVFSLANHIA